MKNRIVVIGAGISGVGAAVLAKKKGFEVFVSDKGIITEYSNRSRQIILDSDNPYDSAGRYNIVGVDPDDGLRVYNKDGQSSYQWNLGFKYQF